jgi:hypothetical protein
MTTEEFPPEDNLALAQRRAERVLEHGTTVVGISLQAALAGMSVMWLLQAFPSAPGDQSQIWFFSLAVLGIVITVASWLVARRRNLLQPFGGTDLEHPLRVLNDSQQKAIEMQLRGRVAVTPESAPLVRAMLLGRRRATRVILPSLAGVGLGLLASGAKLSLTLGEAWPWLLLLELGAVVSVTAMLTVEARRRKRVLAAVTELGVPDRTSR